jgi:cytochrome P450
MFSGGADTSVSSISTFILQMTLHPDIQAKAHAELDCVIGKHTLPTFADEPSLPYIGAIVKEVLR